MGIAITSPLTREPAQNRRDLRHLGPKRMKRPALGVRSWAMTSANEPLVDVGVPACGRPQYLLAAIESVLAQTFDSWRLRISEDGPGGGDIEEAIQPYLADPRISYSATGTRLGAAGNSTRLISVGSAPYVHLLHDDDLLKANFLERHVDFLEANPDCGLVFSAFAEIDADGRKIAERLPSLAEGVYGIEHFVRLLLNHNPISTDNAVVRRAAYAAVGYEFDERFPALYDYEMWLRLAPHFSAGYLAVCDTYWRRHGAQISYGSYRGDEYRRLIQHVDRLLERTRPDLRLTPGLQRRKEASALLTASIDALDQGDPGRSARRLTEALRCSKRLILDPRPFAAIVGLALGGPGRRAVLLARRLLHKRGIRLVYRPFPQLPSTPPEPALTNRHAAVRSPAA